MALFGRLGHLTEFACAGCPLQTALLACDRVSEVVELHGTANGGGCQEVGVNRQRVSLLTPLA